MAARKRRHQLTISVKGESSGNRRQTVETKYCVALNDLPGIASLPDVDIWIPVQSIGHVPRGGMFAPLRDLERRTGVSHVGIPAGAFDALRHVLHAINGGGAQSGLGEMRELRESRAVLAAARDVLLVGHLLSDEELSEVDMLIAPVIALLRGVRNPRKLNALDRLLVERVARDPDGGRNTGMALARVTAGMQDFSDRFQAIRDLAPALTRRAVCIQGVINVHLDLYERLDAVLKKPSTGERAMPNQIRPLLDSTKENRLERIIAILKPLAEAFNRVILRPFSHSSRLINWQLNQAITEAQRGNHALVRVEINAVAQVLEWAKIGRVIDMEIIAPLSFRIAQAERDGRLVRAQAGGKRSAPFSPLIEKEDTTVREVARRIAQVRQRLSFGPTGVDADNPKYLEARLSLDRAFAKLSQGHYRAALNQLKWLSETL